MHVVVLLLYYEPYMLICACIACLLLDSVHYMTMLWDYALVMLLSLCLMWDIYNLSFPNPLKNDIQSA